MAPLWHRPQEAEIGKPIHPGKMPLGRLIATTDLHQVADRGLSGERTYLKGQFVVNFADANKAVLRPRLAHMPDSVMLLTGATLPESLSNILRVMSRRNRVQS